MSKGGETYSDEKKVTEQTLKDGALIGIGDRVFVFHRDFTSKSVRSPWLSNGSRSRDHVLMILLGSQEEKGKSPAARKERTPLKATNTAAAVPKPVPGQVAIILTAHRG